MVFTLLRYGLLPVVFYCAVVFVSGVHIIGSNEAHRSSWKQTTATVMQSRDFGDAYAEFSGTKNDFPDPRGTLQYVVNKETAARRGPVQHAILRALPAADDN
jgi:hypothetical protein